jgi:GntR family transcriptional regulator
MIQFVLNPRSGVPIYRQIQDLIRHGVASGRLFPGEQLPTVRGLAAELRVNPNTVIRAYTELERQGVLTTEQGSGTFVAAEPPPVPLGEAERRAKLEELCREFLSHAARYGFAPAEIVRAIQDLGTRSIHS